ncbi:MAG: hypothetical protein HGA45_21770 [Chloroflexales bacterium]|nr:hypothetical protein [Chloroflexales bacterium]
MRRTSHALAALALLALALAAPVSVPAASPPLTGVFYNLHPSVRAGGMATLSDLAGDRGHLNLTQLTGDSMVLCGAGDFSGAREGQQLRASFVSRDLDRGCGFDHGGIFTITATVGLDERHAAGDYAARNAGGSLFIEAPGVFEVWADGVAPPTVRYTGWLFNQRAGVGGTAVLDLAMGDRTIFGAMNFTGAPGDTTLCGAGPLTGVRREGGTLEWSFVSADADPGCGVDRGLRFVVEAERAANGATIAGAYSLGGSRAGIFELRRASQLYLPMLGR